MKQIVMAPHPVDIHVGKRLRACRSMLGMSQEQIAKAIGVTFQQVQKYERGVNRMGASRLHDFAKILGVSVNYFFEEFDNGTLKAANAGFAEGGDSFQAEQLNRKETLTLVRNYYSISDPEVRKRVSGLIKAIATSENEK